MTLCFLDTSAVIDILRNNERAKMAADAFDVALISCIVLGELRVGVHTTVTSEAEKAMVERALADTEVISIDPETAHLYGEICSSLEAKGRRIPTNDIWIAATCVQFELPLISRDLHFDRIPQLSRIAY